MVELTDVLVDEYLKRLEREGHSDEYIDGSLDGISFVVEFYLSMMKLKARKEKMIREEYNVKTQSTS